MWPVLRDKMMENVSCWRGGMRVGGRREPKREKLLGRRSSWRGDDGV